MARHKIDCTIDIRGDICPYTFVKSKLALENMKSGQVLEIIVDHAPAIENVPRSMESEGHKVLEVTQLDQTTWKIVIQKS